MARWGIGLVAVACLLAIAVFGGAKVYRALTITPLDTPPALGLAQCADPDLRKGKTVVIAIGDSLTRGNMSANYVEAARALLGDDYLVLNAGVNGAYIADAAARLDRVVACDPDIVTMMIGTNDAVHWTGTPSPDWAPETAMFSGMLQGLQRDTSAAIAVFSLPYAGEAPEGRLNQLVAGLSEALTREAIDLGVIVLALRERQEALMDALDGQGEWPRCETMADVHAGMAPIIPLAERRGARLDYDKLAAEAGHVLVIDCVHLSARAADPAARLMVEFVQANRSGNPAP